VGQYPAITPPTFVSGEGRLLPAGTWYPMIGAPGATPTWRVSLAAPPGLVTVTPYDTVRGSTPPGRPLAGREISLSMVGGHLAPVGRVGGFRLYAAADQADLARAALRWTPPASGRSAGTVGAALAAELRPEPRGAVVIATTGPEFSGALPLGADQRPWQLYFDDAWPWTPPGPLSFGDGGGPSPAYAAEVQQNLGDVVLALWLGGTVPAVAPPAQHLIGGLQHAIGVNGFWDTATTPQSSEIAALPIAARRSRAERARRLFQSGHLTGAALGRLIRQARQAPRVRR
jgi:hypothetical protein